MKNSQNTRADKSLEFTSFTGIGRLILLVAVILFAVTAFAQTPVHIENSI